jgi:hypothetical protein
MMKKSIEEKPKRNAFSKPKNSVLEVKPTEEAKTEV